MNKISVKLTEYILNKGIIRKEDYALYLYGIQSGLESLICIIVGFIIAMITGFFDEYIIVLCILMPVRSYVDGLHMKKFYICMIISVTILTCGPVFVRAVSISEQISFILCIIVMLVIHIISCKTNKKRFDKATVKYYAKQRIKIFLFITMALTILYKLKLGEYMELVLYALIFSLLTIITEIVKNY